MEKFEKLEGVAAPLNIVNIDTDMIIPKQFLKTIRRTGLGKSLFYEMRFTQGGQELPEFVLNKQPTARRRSSGGRQFRLRLIARTCALGAAGFRHPLRHLHQLCRYLLQQLLQERHSAHRRFAGDQKLMDDAERGANATLSVDLPNQEIRGPDGGKV